MGQHPAVRPHCLSHSCTNGPFSGDPGALDSSSPSLVASSRPHSCSDTLLYAHTPHAHMASCTPPFTCNLLCPHTPTRQALCCRIHPSCTHITGTHIHIPIPDKALACMYPHTPYTLKLPVTHRSRGPKCWVSVEPDPHNLSYLHMCAHTFSPAISFFPLLPTPPQITCGCSGIQTRSYTFPGGLPLTCYALWSLYLASWVSVGVPLSAPV